jgi:ribosomal protein L37AE/L43A
MTDPASPERQRIASAILDAVGSTPMQRLDLEAWERLLTCVESLVTDARLGLGARIDETLMCPECKAPTHVPSTGQLALPQTLMVCAHCGTSSARASWLPAVAGHDVLADAIAKLAQANDRIAGDSVRVLADSNKKLIAENEELRRELAEVRATGVASGVDAAGNIVVSSSVASEKESTPPPPMSTFSRLYKDEDGVPLYIEHGLALAAAELVVKDSRAAMRVLNLADFERMAHVVRSVLKPRENAGADLVVPVEGRTP